MNGSDRQVLVDQVNQLHLLIRYDINQLEHLKTSIETMTVTLVRTESQTVDSYTKQMHRDDIYLIHHQIDQLDHLNKKLLNNILNKEDSIQGTILIISGSIILMRDILVNRIRKLEAQPTEFVAPPSLVRRKKYTREVKIKTKTLSKTELETNLEDCGICLQPHIKIDSLTCSCNHSFGKVCFNAWMKICKTHNNIVSCPLCRTKVEHTVTFRAKQVRVPKKTRVVIPVVAVTPVI